MSLGREEALKLAASQLPTLLSQALPASHLQVLCLLRACLDDQVCQQKVPYWAYLFSPCKPLHWGLKVLPLADEAPVALPICRRRF